ncbi:alpha/beta-hydrolase [Myriangium duriaei CBS 260.36]|uniref:Carboxypeptidase n=1 Tax=Myriangium duriaei CBS 260.36 TaxID=1168546 RepID=A0A9P4MGQ5_9PEZI|nr:alpha/beta-hydrolase [Myriangium duriaei CBS 260.36]
MLNKHFAAMVLLGRLLTSFAWPDVRLRQEYKDKNVTAFEHAETGARLEFITNSGICETTPGVNQYSGYLSMGNETNMWFWFFEARKHPDKAPLAMWFNGGPGSSSMVGLFQENDPCHFVNGSDSPSLNPYSFNEYANMLYIDQPVDAGFSYGTDRPNTTVTAAPYVWILLQAFYAHFPRYKNRDFGIFTESYGGIYGSEFASFFQSQNRKISQNLIRGTQIPIRALGINNGWYDATIQYQAYVDYSYNNSYRQLINESESKNYNQAMRTKCIPALQHCTAPKYNDSACAYAQATCNKAIRTPLRSVADFNIYDVRSTRDDPNPPRTYRGYLNSTSVRYKIGAKKAYVPYSNAVDHAFSTTGDNCRSSLPALSQVVSSGVRVLLYAGDADWMCNYLGGVAVANAVNWSGQDCFRKASLEPYTVNGHAVGLFKSVKNLSWLQVYGSGHEVPYYTPELALQVFRQTMGRQPIRKT